MEQKMLESENVKVIFYEKDSSKIFPNTDIKGGITVTYFDKENKFDPIGVFTSYDELTSIAKKVTKDKFVSFSKMIYNRGLYRYSDLIYKEHPNDMKKISDRRLGSNAFEKLPELFYDIEPKDKNNYVKIIGRFENNRIFKYFRKDYMNNPDNLNKYKVIMPQANGSGKLGEIIASPLILNPNEGHTETFLSIGSFDNVENAHAVLKYIKTKFARALLGILKVTQANTSYKWEYVPLQDFTENSDIDWSQSIREIDQQLYKKYGLNDEEIQFIEQNVQEMQ